MRRFLMLLALLCCPTTEAREVYTLNEGWRFFFADETTSDNARVVSIPHTWNRSAAGCSGPYRRTSAHYVNTLVVPAEWEGKRLFIKFYGVQQTADLFVNGCHAGEHRGGSTAFAFEITDRVRCGGENYLTVVVSNQSQNDLLPASTDLNLYGGIYRDVELIVTEPTAVSPLYLGSDGVLIHPRSVTGEKVEGEAEIHLLGRPGSSALLTMEITAPDGTSVFRRSHKSRLDGKPVILPFQIEQPQLWSPRSTALYRVTAIVGEGASADTVTVRTGFRSIDADTSTGLRINGERVNVHGVTLRYDHVDAGNALRSDHYDEDFALIREVGANALRSPSGPHAQYLYDLCDETGVLAWIDLPFTRAPFLSDIAYYATERFRENGRRQLCEIIAQNCNHPSVVMWGLFSSLRPKGGDEVTGYLRDLNQLAHTLDSSRPTVASSNQDGDINFITDLIVWQQNIGWERGTTEDLLVWSSQLHTKWSNLRSAVIYGEEGCTTHQGDVEMRSARQNWLPEGRQTRFHEEYARHIEGDSLFWGCWLNSLADYGSSRRPSGICHSGLVTFDRKERKDVFYLYKALWNKQEPTLYIADRRNRLSGDTLQLFKIYSSREAPTLRVNGDTVELFEYAPCQYLSDTVPINGYGVIEAAAGGLTDRIEIRTGIALKPRPQRAPRRKAGR